MIDYGDRGKRAHSVAMFDLILRSKTFKKAGRVAVRLQVDLLEQRSLFFVGSAVSTIMRVDRVIKALRADEGARKMPPPSRL